MRIRDGVEDDSRRTLETSRGRQSELTQLGAVHGLQGATRETASEALIGARVVFSDGQYGPALIRPGSVSRDGTTGLSADATLRGS